MGAVTLNKVKNPFMREELEEAITKYMALNPINGNAYYVHDSGSSGASGRNIDSPINTIDGAFNNTTEDNGDIIFVLPNHAETLAAASAIDFDKKGVRIIGLGSGEDRPKITFGTDTGASIEFASNGITFVNFILIAGIDGLTGPLWVKSSGNVIQVETRDGSSTVEAERWLLSTADADNNKIKTNHIGFPAGDAGVNWGRLVGANNWDIEINYYGLASTAIIEFITTACTNIRVKGQTYNSTTTDYTKTVVDTEGNGTWSFIGFDGETGQFCSGSQDAAIAAEDVSSVITKLGAMTNTGGTATLTGIIGDLYNIDMATRLIDAVKKTTIADGTTLTNNTQVAAGLLATATNGDCLIEEIGFNRGATNFTGPTNLEFTTDNVAGLTGVDAPVGVLPLADFNANKTIVLSLDGATKQLPFILESGKKLYIHGDDAAVGAGGSTDFFIKYKRMASNAYLG